MVMDISGDLLKQLRHGCMEVGPMTMMMVMIGGLVPSKVIVMAMGGPGVVRKQTRDVQAVQD